MKQVLGLDIGVSSIGWALIKEDDEGHKMIEKLGVRVVPDDPNFHQKFVEGNTASKNASRREKRGARRNNQRFKLRRDRLETLLKNNDMYPDKALLLEMDKVQLYRLRAEAASKKISLIELGRVFLLLNQRRGFLSNRKAQSADESNTDYKKQLAENEARLGDFTIGQFAYLELTKSPHAQIRNRVYLRKTYLEEFNRIWETQSVFYPEILTGSPSGNHKNTLYDEICNKTIFYQRPLKSQKHLIAECQHEKYHKVAPKSSPFFQVFRIWQQITNFRYWPNGRPKNAEALNEEQREKLFTHLNDPQKLDTKGNLKDFDKVIFKKILGIDATDYSVNYPELIGNRTLKKLVPALENAEVDHIDDLITFFPAAITDNGQQPDFGNLYKLWHILYSIENDQAIAAALERQFNIPPEKGLKLAKDVHFESDYGSFSVKAIRKTLPHLQAGLTYDKACVEVNYINPEHVKRESFLDELPLLKPNELRNPVVEQILNQLINVVNQVKRQYGNIDEIRIELARELKNNAKTRNKIFKSNKSNKRKNDEIAATLQNEYKFKVVNGRDLKRYKLWQETDHLCLYCLRKIENGDLLGGNADADHILPRSRTFNDSMNNLVISHARCNRDKGQATAYDYIGSKGGDLLSRYITAVEGLYAGNKISKAKFENLLMPGEQIQSGFLERQIKDTQYISKKAIEILKQICPKVTSTTGTVTSFLRDKWGLNHVLQELVLPLYRQEGQVTTKLIKDGNNGTAEKEIPVNWSKRDDHRHHAVDALVTAFTNASIIQKLNNLNKIYQLKKEREWIEDSKRPEGEKLSKEDRLNLSKFAEEELLVFPEPMPNFRQEAKKELEAILISIKKQSKVLSPKTNIIKTRNGTISQKTYVPRFNLHEETVLGTIKVAVKLPLKKSADRLDDIKNGEIKALMQERLEKYGSVAAAFAKKNTDKDPFLYKGKALEVVEVWEKKHTKRVKVNKGFTPAQLGKIVDSRIKELFEQRVESYGTHKKAFDSYESEPEYHDKERTIPIRSVKVFDEGKLVPLREIEGQAVDFVYTKGNHHALIYKDHKGNYVDRVVSKWEATQIALQQVREEGKLRTVINRKDIQQGEQDLQFVYDLQVNDYVLIDFDYDNIDVFDEANYPLVSKHLFRVQKMSKNKAGAFDIMFRHHLESSINRDSKELRGVTWEKFQSNKNFKRLAKAQLNNLGKIIALYRP